MTRHLPAQTPPVRVIHYVDPATRTVSPSMTDLSPAELIHTLRALSARREVTAADQRARHAAWLLRQDEIRAHDRRVRRTLLVAIPTGLALLAAGGWVLAQTTVAAVSTGTVLGGLVVAALAVLLVGAVGRRCVTVVQHWHE